MGMDRKVPSSEDLKEALQKPTVLIAPHFKHPLKAQKDAIDIGLAIGRANVNLCLPAVTGGEKKVKLRVAVVWAMERWCNYLDSMHFTWSRICHTHQHQPSSCLTCWAL